jgi:hypothetical protein
MTLQSLNSTDTINLKFDKDELKNLEPYFNIDFPSSSLNNKIQFFTNLYRVGSKSLGLAHCIQHNLAARVAIQLSDCVDAKKQVLSSNFYDTIGCYSIVKRSDEISYSNNTLNGKKKWFSNLNQADYGVLQIATNNKAKLLYFDLSKLKHQIDYDFFTPIGMELAQAGTLEVNNQSIDPSWELGRIGTEQYFLQSNFTSYCFITNHCSLARELLLDIKKYVSKYNCGTEFDIKKLEIDVCALQMQWESNLSTLNETTLSDEFWHRRNTQYAFSKKTLISIIQFILEVGVSYYVDAKSKFSQRFRDAITYVGHMHPLYKFCQEFHLINLE